MSALALVVLYLIAKHRAMQNDHKSTFNAEGTSADIEVIGNDNAFIALVVLK